jgi:hypothetical protein
LGGGRIVTSYSDGTVVDIDSDDGMKVYRPMGAGPNDWLPPPGAFNGLPQPEMVEIDPGSDEAPAWVRKYFKRG